MSNAIVITQYFNINSDNQIEISIALLPLPKQKYIWVKQRKVSGPTPKSTGVTFTDFLDDQLTAADGTLFDGNDNEDINNYILDFVVDDSDRLVIILGDFTLIDFGKEKKNNRDTLEEWIDNVTRLIV